MATADAHPDVIGFGALNLDYIAGASKLSAAVSDLVRESTARFEWGVESAVDEETIYQAIERLGASSLDAALGGSAWNTIYTLADMGLDLRLGYIGFVGKVGFPGLSFIRQMDRLGVDRRFVGRTTTQSCGVCLSYIEDGERVLLTHPGANIRLCDYITENFDGIVRYLASARIVHVTSFFDDRTPMRAYEAIRGAKELNDDLLLSFDPGHAWSVDQPPVVERLLELTDYLLVNYREFKALGRYCYGESDEAVASRLLARCSRRCVVVVPKRYDTVEVFHEADGAVYVQQFSQSPMRHEKLEIEDATGAGDILAAGLLAALGSTKLRVELGAFLGMNLARHKMRHVAFEGHGAFPSLAGGFLQSADTWQQETVLSRAVFISHGVDTQWQLLKQFIEEECMLPVHALGPEDAEEGTAALGRHLESCSFAICVLTVEDVMKHGARRANQAVVHQAGLFHGRYGFGRVAMLVEDDCEVFSNVAGLIQLDFRRGRIETTFWELKRMLRREGMLPSRAFD